MTSPVESHPPRLRRATREDVRRRLLDAARSEFATHGYDGVSLEQIAAAAGFSKGAVYSNFATKNDLFLALLDESVGARLAVAIELQQSADRPDRESVGRQLGDRLIAQFAADVDWQVLLIEFWMRAMRDPAVRAPFAEHRRRFRRAIADAYEATVPEGDPELSAMEVATLILALANGIAIERLLDPGAGDDALLGIALQRVAFTAPTWVEH